MTDDDRWQWRQRKALERIPQRQWPRFAEAMGWEASANEPSWMAPDERAWFWREVAEANRRNLRETDLARIRVEIERQVELIILIIRRAVDRIARMQWPRR